MRLTFALNDYLLTYSLTFACDRNDMSVNVWGCFYNSYFASR